MLHRHRAGVGLIAAAVAIPLAIAATAFACANLTTLKLVRGAAAAGSDVTAYGRNYSSNPQASPVALRFNGRAGRILAEVRPAANGKITATFKVPPVQAGRYVIVATQTGADGRPVGGTPGRAPFKVTRGGSATVVAPPAGTSTPTLPSTPVAVGLAALMLGLAGGGVALVGGARRRSAASA